MNYLNILIVCLLLAVVVACKKEKDDINSPTPTPPPASISSYPLTVGNSWKYHTEIHVDTSGLPFYDAYYDHYWTVISDTSIIGIPSTKIAQLDSNYDGFTRIAHTYYANRPDGFYLMAATNSGSMLFLRSKEVLNDFSISLLNAFTDKLQNTDTIFIPDSSLHLMKFPIVQNEKWHSYEYGLQFKIKRQWLGDAIVITPAGIFACKKLQILFDFDDDGQNDPDALIVYQYFSTKGLIKETQYGVLNSGFMTLNRTTELVSVNF